MDASLTLSAQDETASNGGKPNEVQTAEPVPVNVPHTHSAPTRHPLKSALKSSSQPREKVASTAASNNNESNQAGGEEGEEDDLSDLYPEVTPEVLLEVCNVNALHAPRVVITQGCPVAEITKLAAAGNSTHTGSPHYQPIRFVHDAHLCHSY